MAHVTTFIGIGLIGASMALAMKRANIGGELRAVSRTQASCDEALTLGLVQQASCDAAAMVDNADIVVLATPVGSMAAVMASIAPHLKQGAIITDVGSVKTSVIQQIEPLLPAGAAFVPAHPIAGTEHSGPGAGFAELFDNRWTILTPTPATPAAATTTIEQLWQKIGSKTAVMSAAHHDQILAITSHLPHLIAYTIVGTAVDLETSLQHEVCQYAAGGFRDFTRIAASDPVMWRDIFLHNKEAVLEMLGRFSEDLASLQKAIRWDDGAALEAHFTRTRAIRRGVIAEQQA